MELFTYYKNMGGPFLNGRVAVITGGSRGLGRAMALTFAQLGAKIVLTCVSRPDLAEEVRREIKKNGGEAVVFYGDLSDFKEAERLIEETVMHWDVVDILVNNAGITDPRHFDLIKKEDWDRLVSVDLNSVYNTCKCAVPYLRKSKAGRIVNLSSICAKNGAIGSGAHYCAVKAGIIGFTKALAIQLAPDGITVNSIAPAMIDTEMIQWRSPELMREHVQLIPLKRVGECREVAEPCAFLCSDYASYITGYCMDINGGLYMD